MKVPECPVSGRRQRDGAGGEECSFTRYQGECHHHHKGTASRVVCKNTQAAVNLISWSDTSNREFSPKDEYDDVTLVIAPSCCMIAAIRSRPIIGDEEVQAENHLPKIKL